MILLSPQLQAFVAVAKHGTVHQASFDLKITQTGVTQRLKALEAQLKLAVFERSRKGMRLTAEGQALLRYCQKVLELEGETLALLDSNAADDGRTIQRLSIAGPSSLMRARIIPQTASLIKAYPLLRLSYDIDDSADSASGKLRGASIQMALLPREAVAKEMDSKLIKPEAYILAVPTAWKRRSLKDIVTKENIVDFSENDDMTFQFLRMMNLLDSFKGSRHFANNTDALASMIEAGMGYSVLAKDFADPLIKEGRLAMLAVDKIYQIAFALAWYPRPEMPAYFKAVVQSIT